MTGSAGGSRHGLTWGELGMFKKPSSSLTYKQLWRNYKDKTAQVLSLAENAWWKPSEAKALQVGSQDPEGRPLPLAAHREAGAGPQCVVALRGRRPGVWWVQGFGDPASHWLGLQSSKWQRWLQRGHVSRHLQRQTRTVGVEEEGAGQSAPQVTPGVPSGGRRGGEGGRVRGGPPGSRKGCCPGEHVPCLSPVAAVPRGGPRPLRLWG